VCGCGGAADCGFCKGTEAVFPLRCPEHYLDRDIALFFELYNDYNKRGLLPYPGGRLEQPKVLFMYFDELEYYIRKHRDVHSKLIERNREAGAQIRRGLARGR